LPPLGFLKPPHPLQVAYPLPSKLPSGEKGRQLGGVRGRGVAAFLGRGGFFPSPFIMGFLDREEEG